MSTDRGRHVLRIVACCGAFLLWQLGILAEAVLIVCAAVGVLSAAGILTGDPTLRTVLARAAGWVERRISG